MAVGASAYRAVCADVSGGHEVVVAVHSLRVELSETLAYWTVVDEQWLPVPLADSFLRDLRLGADRAEGTTRTYAGDLACYLEWCAVTGRDLPAGARALGMFVAMLKTTAVVRPGAGRGRVRSPGRINHLLAAVREFYKHAVADGAVDAAVLAALYEVGDDRHLPAELRPEGSGLRYRARPRHVQRTRRSRRQQQRGADDGNPGDGRTGHMTGRHRRAQHNAFAPQFSQVVIKLQHRRAAPSGHPRLDLIDDARQQRREEQPDGEAQKNVEHGGHWNPPQ